MPVRFFMFGDFIFENCEVSGSEAVILLREGDSIQGAGPWLTTSMVHFVQLWPLREIGA